MGPRRTFGTLEAGLPSPKFDDTADRSLRNSVSFRKGLLLDSVPVGGPDFSVSFQRELGREPTAVAVAALGNHVGRVVLGASPEKITDAAVHRIVVSVKREGLTGRRGTKERQRHQAVHSVILGAVFAPQGDYWVGVLSLVRARLQHSFSATRRRRWGGPLDSPEVRDEVKISKEGDGHRSPFFLHGSIVSDTTDNSRKLDPAGAGAGRGAISPPVPASAPVPADLKGGERC